MGITWSQLFPPTPVLTEDNLPDQSGKVFIVTGGTSGVGYELCRILYQAGGKVYMAGRSATNATFAMDRIRSLPCLTPGELIFLEVHLDDLKTIKPAVEKFVASESRLHVLFNNAGVSNPPRDILSAQGHEMQMSTNCFAPYLMTQLLLPVLLQTAKDCPPATVRVVWTSSIVVDTAPTGGFAEHDFRNPSRDQQQNYTITKLGNWYLADELAREVRDQGILSVTQNPGNLKTPLIRHLPSWVGIMASPLLYHAKMGAYTELWAGLSQELGMEDNGCYLLPWGRKHPAPRRDLIEAVEEKEDKRLRKAEVFRELCESHTVQFR